VMAAVNEKAGVLRSRRSACRIPVETMAPDRMFA
jgi:hypothetical protein